MQKRWLSVARAGIGTRLVHDDIRTKADAHGKLLLRFALDEQGQPMVLGGGESIKATPHTRRKERNEKKKKGRGPICDGTRMNTCRRLHLGETVRRAWKWNSKVIATLHVTRSLWSIVTNMSNAQGMK